MMNNNYFVSTVQDSCFLSASLVASVEEWGRVLCDSLSGSSPPAVAVSQAAAVASCRSGHYPFIPWYRLPAVPVKSVSPTLSGQASSSHAASSAISCLQSSLVCRLIELYDRFYWYLYRIFQRWNTKQYSCIKYFWSRFGGKNKVLLSAGQCGQSDLFTWKVNETVTPLNPRQNLKWIQQYSMKRIPPKYVFLNMLQLNSFALYYFSDIWSLYTQLNVGTEISLVEQLDFWI